MRLVHLVPLLLQILFGRKAKASSDSASLDMWAPSNTDAIFIDAGKWSGTWWKQKQYEDRNRQYHPDGHFRMIGWINLNITSSQDLLIYFDPFEPIYTRIEVSCRGCQ